MASRVIYWNHLDEQRETTRLRLSVATRIIAQLRLVVTSVESWLDVSLISMLTRATCRYLLLGM